MKRTLLFVLGIALVGCTGEIEVGPSTWTLTADPSHGLVDGLHPEFGSYPNPREVDSIQVTLSLDGQLCAVSDEGAWCGGPIQGIPYVVTATMLDDKTCLQVSDIYGNPVLRRCGLPTDFTIERPPAGCRASETSLGPCEVCIDDGGTVTRNTCAPGPANTGGCDTDDKALVLGISLFQDAFNNGLDRIGLPFHLIVPTSVDWLVNFDEGDINLNDPSCLDVFDYLDDEFSDDHPGTDDYVFGDEAIAECLNRGRCRIGQLVTRSMAAACQAIPVGCSIERVQLGIIGSGGYAVKAVCEDEPNDDADKVGVDGDDSDVVECVGSPLVIDLAGDGLSLTGPRRDAQFDLMGAGPMTTGWIGGGDALLALDIDGDGAITSGRELFGEATGGWAPDGFAALARHDDNGDRVIDARDAIYRSLLAWIDDGAAVSQPNELVPLSTAGVVRIDLDAEQLDATDQFGNQLRLSGQATTRSGARAPVVDVWFRMGAN